MPPGARAAVNPAAVVISERSQAAMPGGSLTLTAEIAAGYGSALRWERNGAPIAGATSASLTLPDLQPASAGLYALQSTLPAGSTTSNPTIVGVTSAAKVIGAGEEVVPANVKHPNGNVYDQILLNGVAATITADSTSDQVSRLSFIDDNDDIVQVEFAGPGTLTLMLDAERSPAAPRNYSQAVSYMKGRAGIVITGADERTNVSVFCVGRATAFDPSGAFDITRAIGPGNDPARNGSPLFVGHDSTRYDGIADLAFIAIASRNGRFGGVRTANTRFSASAGAVGLYAPNVVFDGPVFVGNINAGGSARPMLVGGSVGEMRICGGDLFQDNGRPVQVSGIVQIVFTAGIDAHGKPVSAKGNRGRLEDDGQDVTAQVVMNP